MLRFCTLIPLFFIGLHLQSHAEVPSEIEQLEQRISHLNAAYWQEGKREVSDLEYDQLLEELREASPSSVLLNHDGEWLGLIGADKIRHQKPLLSLNKCYRKQDIVNWCKKVSRDSSEVFVIQPKYDGIALEYFSDQLSTRGDGLLGENVSAKAAIIRYLPKKPEGRAVGELMLSDKEFERLKKYRPDYVSSRHAVVGMAHALDLSFWKEHAIEFNFISYSYLEKKYTLSELEHEWDELVEWIRSIGYATDGFVVKVADATHCNQLGSTKQAPRGALAFKWGSERKWTTLLAVEWQMSAKGLVPVGILKPLLLENKKIERIYLYNNGYIRDKGLQLGDRLQIECVGGTIPVIKQIEQGIERQKINLTRCPECGGKVTKDEKHAFICEQEFCPGKITILVYKEIQKRKIKGFGLKTVRKLVDGLKLLSWQDLEGKSIDELEQVNGVSRKKAILLHSKFTRL